MRILAAICLVIPLLLSVPGQAQTDRAQQPLVVFVEEPTLRMSSVTDSGPDGLTRLASIFESLGARTTWQRLRDPLPADTSVVVLVRPRAGIPVDYLARLWQRVGAGSSLLLALDPQGYQNIYTEAQNRGIDRLLSQDEGVSLYNGILIEPWFVNQSFNELYGTFSYGYADPAANPITEPLQRYKLPVALWGARPLLVDAFGANHSQAWPLVDASPEYVETAADIFPKGSDGGQPFQLDLDQDRQGIVNVVGIGENQAVGSRVALLGDSEIVQNGYGLSLALDTRTPLYAADYILTQRLAAWLLHLPEAQYPALPNGMTWIAVDGSAADWPNNAAVTPDDPADVSILSLNIQQVRAFRNNNYVYLSIETVAPPSFDSQIDLELDTLGTGKTNAILSARPGQVVAQTGSADPTPIDDAEMAIGDTIELRIPLRLTGPSPQILDLCLSSSRELAFPQAPDCLGVQLRIANINQTDPVPLRLTNSIILAVKGNGRDRVNLRSQPDDKSQVITSVPYGTIFAAVGVSSNGEWVRLANAVYEGWVSRASLFAPGNLESLPVLK